ncbi:MAG: GntR family transcriptional regulator [Hyphomicrobiales bacterium]
MTLRARRHSIPLYTQVANALRGEIEAGVWARGQQLPAIEELAARFGVARATMRQALELVEEEGLVICRQGRGTFVQQGARERRWLPLASNWSTFLRMIEPLRPRLLQKEGTELQPRLLEGEGRPAPVYQHLKRVHYRDDRPFCAIDIYLAADIYLKAPEEFRRHVIVPVLAKVSPTSVDKVRQTLTVNGADQKTAVLLDLPIGSPVATVRRTITDKSGTCVYIADVIYRGDVVKLEIDLSPSPGELPT